jgi:hypothetical protein
MKKNIVIALLAGFGLIGIVLFKNIYKLEKKIQREDEQLRTYENDLLTINLPRNLIHESDTTYLESGELFNTVQGVGGSLDNYGNIVRYSLSIATYNKNFTTTESFHLDSLKRNLHKRFDHNDLQVLRIDNIEINGIRGLTYIGRTGPNFEKCVMFALNNNIIAINMNGSDSTDGVFENIVKSMKIKKHLTN